MQYDIFISYSRKDSAIVEQYSEYLNAAGLSVWIDKEGIETGDEFKRNIVRAIKNSDVFLFFSSANSNASPWTVKEVNVAVNCKKRIIPVKLDSTPYEESIMFDLAGLDFFDHANNGFEIGIEKLLSVFGKDYSLVVEHIKKEAERKQIEEDKKQQEELFRQQAAIEAQKRIEEEKLARIREEEYKRALAAAEENARKEKEAKAFEKQKNNSTAKVHLCVDADSRVYYQNKEIVRCSAHEEVIVDLPFGEHTLKIISVEDNSVKKQLSVNVNSSSITIDEIKISSIIKRKKTIVRKQKEEEERRRRDEQFRRALEEKLRAKRFKEAEKEREHELIRQKIKKKIALFKRNVCLSNTSDIFLVITFVRVLIMFVGVTIYGLLGGAEFLGFWLLFAVTFGGADVFITSVLESTKAKIRYQIFAIGCFAIGWMVCCFL